jgi:hypothetical protein
MHQDQRRWEMKAATAAFLLASMLMFGAAVTLSGDKVRGEKGKGEVHQHMKDCNHEW